MAQELPDTVFAGRYRLIGPIGRGAFGTVYKAMDPVLNRVIAVKALGARTGWPRQALAREATASSSLSHPNIVRVFEFFETGGAAFIAMEFIEGRSLADILREGKPLDQDYVIAIAADVGSALAYAHRRQVIHRDVKPSNILISKSGRVLLTDFGLAIASGDDTLTSAGTILGTPRYMSPEQAMGRPLDGRSDIYSLAIVVYEALCGEPWVDATDPVKILERLVTTPVEPIRQRNPKVNAAIELVLARALSKEPADRYQTADQFVQALRDPVVESVGVGLTAGEPPRWSLEESYGRALSFQAEIPADDIPRRQSLALDRRILFLAGIVVAGFIAAWLVAPFTPFPASVLFIVLLLAGAAWYVFRATKNANQSGESDEPPETTEAAPYEGISVPPSRPRMFGQALVDAPTAETPAYLPTDFRPTPALQDPTAGSWLLVLNGPHQGRQFSLGLNVAIGRSPSNAVVLDNDPGVSRRHAEIVLQGSRFQLRDLRSKTGTLVNNVKIDHRELRDRDQIRVGGTILLFISAAEANETGADAKRRLVELDHRMVQFSAIWNDLTRVAHDDE